jgi:hypothetical protein
MEYLGAIEYLGSIKYLGTMQYLRTMQYLGTKECLETMEYLGRVLRHRLLPLGGQLPCLHSGHRPVEVASGHRPVEVASGHHPVEVALDSHPVQGMAVALLQHSRLKQGPLVAQHALVHACACVQAN